MKNTSEAYILHYIDTIKTRYAMGISTEHTYRADLQTLLYAICTDIIVTNEPKRQACGAPDYIITNKKNIPIGYIEAKDIGKSLNSKGFDEQFNRYRKELDNLIITDYLEFKFYRDSEEVTSISIAKIIDGKVVAQPAKFDEFINLLRSFCLYLGQTIKSSSKLSKMMALKARRLGTVINNALDADDKAEVSSTLKEQMLAFKHILIHDISNKEFADIYAQTIAYGMFAARLHDETLDTFSRQEAAELIPKSNPFLRSLFGYIAGPDIDDRIEWIVSDLADIFRATDVSELLKDFGKATAQTDPMIHFYETFLGEYDKKLKKARGVWYTPEPVVKFIVRAVDDILKSEFGLSQGLADTSKTKIQIKSAQGGDRRFKDGHKRIEKEVHRVQILDPATGTGTFLAEVVKHIHTKFKNQQGIWSGYVEDHLIPRLNGFEILMASYAMAHLKLDLLLTELGYKPTKQQRLKVFLTNSLEEHHPDTDTLFATWLAREADEANRIKRDTPVMVVLGNPPYSGESSNKGLWIEKLLKDYKQEPTGGKLQEKNSKWLNDDYVKFIRYGQHYIEKNSEGILAYINPHGFLDNPTFRGMRWNLINTFDKIYMIDLHGNAKKKEVCPDGSPDKNIFDIQQGVSINIFIKTGQKKKGELAKVYHADVWGGREFKYSYLLENNLKKVKFVNVKMVAPQYYFVPKDFELQKEYEKGLQVSKIFSLNSISVVTARDKLTIQDSTEIVEKIIHDFASLDSEVARNKYNIKKDARDWKIHLAQKDLLNTGLDKNNIQPIAYRPFDIKYTYFTGNSKGFHCMPRGNVMQHFIRGKNLGLIFRRQQLPGNQTYYFISKNIVSDGIIRSDNKGGESIAPLYIYPEDSSLENTRSPNLNYELVQKIARGLKLTYTPEKEANKGTFAPIDILDYIYAVLYSPSYRKKYQEFLIIDFPRVPYPALDTFWQLVELGGKLRQVHLLESPEVEEYITSYPIDGNNTITRRIEQGNFKLTDENNGLGRVWINDEQYFDNIPVTAWEFYIGGYQPAQKWLKDRKERTLGFEDILHYQKIVKALMLTDQYMKEIDRVVSWKY